MCGDLQTLSPMKQALLTTNKNLLKVQFKIQRKEQL